MITLYFHKQSKKCNLVYGICWLLPLKDNITQILATFVETNKKPHSFKDSSGTDSIADMQALKSSKM